MKNKKIEKIIIALDYDPTAKEVAETGYSIAKSMNAEVVLLHVISNLEHYQPTRHIRVMGFAGLADKVPLNLDNIDELKKVAQQFLNKTKQHIDDESIQTIVKEGNLEESIIMAAKNLKVDLIVIGSYSRKWSENKFMEGITERILLHSNIPVLIIPIKKQQKN
jgi:nucleotide-binding universal stress UspA family protein